MVARGPALVLDALAVGRAVPAFTVHTPESVRTVSGAAGSADPPVVLQVGSTSFRDVSRPMLAAAALVAAGEASVPVGVQLDHSTDLEEIRACVALRCTPVMVDGSHLPFAENVAFTRVVVDEAHDAGCGAERADDIRVLQRKAIDAMAEVAVEQLGVLSGAGFAVNPGRKDDR